MESERKNCSTWDQKVANGRILTRAGKAKKEIPVQNNVVEQDHRRIDSRVQPGLGFKTFSRWV